MDTEYTNALMTRGYDDCRAQVFSEDVDRLFEQVAGQVDVPPGFKVQMYGELLLAGRAIIVHIKYDDLNWMSRWDFEDPVCRIVEEIRRAIQEIRIKAGKRHGERD